MKYKLWAIAIFFQFVCAALASTEIYYPGTFDPFHNTHLSEVRYAQALFPNANIVVLPIESAYYNRLDSGVERPQFVPYTRRLSLIASTFSDTSCVTVKDSLRSVLDDIFVTLERLASTSKDPDKYLLIGTDVLAIWSQLSNFGILGKHFKFLISHDVHDVELSLRLEQRFSQNDTFTFFAADFLSIRSTLVLTKFFYRENNLSDLVPKPVLDFLNEAGSAESRRFWKECMQYAVALMKSEFASNLGVVPADSDIQDLVLALMRGDPAGLWTGLFSKRLRSTLDLYKGWYQSGAFD